MPKEEKHPLEPFLPKNAKLLMLGTFPPPQKRWCMDFFYPNFINDMWRIFGLVFFGNKARFISGKKFDRKLIEDFLTSKGIALYDTAERIVRLKDNASDKFLRIASPADISSILERIPDCAAIAPTGGKAAETLSEILKCPIPRRNEPFDVRLGNRTLTLFAMPSSSRAYPMPLEGKAHEYEKMFRILGMV